MYSKNMDSDEEDQSPFTTTHHQEEEEDPNHPTKQPQQELYIASIESTLVIKQVPSQGIAFQIWPAANTIVTLLQNFHQNPTTSPLSPAFNKPRSGRLRILELGSGTGLVGIAAAAILGAEVTITDLPHVVQSLEVNAAANFKVIDAHGGSVKVCALRWGEADDMKSIGEFDVVLGSDLVYHDHLFVPLLQTLQLLLNGEGNKGVVLVLGHLKRWKKDSAFFKKAKKLFHVQMMYTELPPDGDRIGVVVYSFVGRCKTGMQSPDNNVCPVDEVLKEII